MWTPTTTLSLVPGKDCAHRIQVRQISVPDILHGAGWDGIDLLKIDIEGYERTLFQSDNQWLRSVRYIVGEAHGHVGYGMEELDADLKPFGFSISALSEDPRHALLIFAAERVMAAAAHA